MSSQNLKIQRRLLKNEAVIAIKEEIARSTWKDKLPSERYLTESLRLSRGTLRGALQILADEGIIKSIPKLGHFITKRPNTKQKKKKSTKSIGLLVGDPDAPRPNRLLHYLQELQSRFAHQGWSIHIHEGIPELHRSPAKAVRKLLEVTDHSCWLLVRCGPQIQSFFQENEIPAVICGSPFPNIELPYVDLDHRATARHAVGTLAARGHRHIGFVISRSYLPGDFASAESFKEAISQSYHNMTNHIIHYPNNKYAFQNLLSGISKGTSPITSLFIDRPLQALNIATRALNLGISLKDQLYILSREDADYLNCLHPNPGRYRFDRKNFAQKVENRVLARMQGDLLKKQGKLVMPDFIE